MGRVKSILFYVAFWVLGAVLSSLTLLVILAVEFMRMVSDGTGDPQLVAGAISDGVVWWFLALPLVTIVTYPIYFSMRNRVKLPWLLTVLLLVAFMLVARALSSVQIVDDVLELARVATAGVFVVTALSLPSRLRKRKIERQTAIENFD